MVITRFSVIFIPELRLYFKVVLTISFRQETALFYDRIAVKDTYALGGDTYRFYEINPDVIELAQDERYFHYLASARSRGAVIEIVPGDARMSMEREVASGTVEPYDVIILDAFSSDSIPVHLLTKEAFACYFGMLKQYGVIAVHITNGNLDLFPVVAAIADEFKFHPIPAVNDNDPVNKVMLSYWVLLTNNPVLVTRYYMNVLPDTRSLWTDDFSNLWNSLSWRM